MAQSSDLESGVGNARVGHEKTQDNVVDWDGPDDPQNPLNWPALKRNSHVAFISIFTMYGYVIALSGYCRSMCLGNDRQPLTRSP